MRVRAALIAVLIVAVCRVFHAQDHSSANTPLFGSSAVLELSLDAPLATLFAHDSGNEDYTVRGALSYRDPSTGRDVAVPGVRISVRGHTSRNETECTFPKLKVKFPAGAAAGSLFDGLSALRIGTHCGDSDVASRTKKFGRLANEASPRREALVYQLLDAIGAPTLRTRPARITYRDPSSHADPLVRYAVLLEDDGDAMRRAGGSAEIAMKDYGNVRARGEEGDALRIAFAEAMVGNFDWCLKYAPGDNYRCDAAKPLWNMLAFAGGAHPPLIMKDFDLAGVVVGRHNWFDKVYNRNYVDSKSPIEIEVISQVERTRALAPRADLDAERQRLMARRPQVQAVLDRSTADAAGIALARRYIDTFFATIADDQSYYRPAVAQTGVQVYADANKTHEACGIKDVMRPGTVVRPLQQVGDMTQVIVLDVMWRWSEPNQCGPVQTHPVWISTAAITTDFPAR